MPTAALADLDELDLRDLRSVVVAADGVARDDESKALKEQLQSGLTRRVEEEHVNWVTDITANLDAGRFVRALRLSSRPPKAGTPVPPELSARLVTAVSEGLTAGTNQELWAAAVDALAFSPVRMQVVPAAKPAEPTEELMEAVRRVADRVPKVAELFGVDPSEAAAAKRRRPPRGRGGKPGGPGGKPGGPGDPVGPAAGRARTDPRRTEPKADRPTTQDRPEAPAETDAPAEAAAPDAPAEAPAPDAPAEAAAPETGSSRTAEAAAPETDSSRDRRSRGRSPRGRAPEAPAETASAEQAE